MALTETQKNNNVEEEIIQKLEEVGLSFEIDEDVEDDTEDLDDVTVTFESLDKPLPDDIKDDDEEDEEEEEEE